VSNVPELPEVEAVRTALAHTIVHKCIVRVAVTCARIVRTPKAVDAFAERLIGQTFVQLLRTGKFLIFALSGGDALITHLRMEGQYVHARPEDAVKPHTHVRFFLCDDSELRYRDVRKFGTMDIVPMAQRAHVPPLQHVGIDALDNAFTEASFVRMLAQRRMRIKPLLLSQNVIAGIGNIYADEVLHRACIHPAAHAHQLTTAEAERLYDAIGAVLRAAVQLGGSTVRSYVDGRGRHGSYQHALRVYGKRGLPCVACGTPIVKTTLAGRGTHLCPVCQVHKS
jgi:formamidopyrimidine-DNA glycosylase